MPLAALFAAAMLQPPAVVTMQTDGEISARDPQAGGEHYDAWPVELRGGRRVTISVTPHGSSATLGLSVHEEAGGRTLAASGGMQLGFTPPSDGIYMVRVTADAYGSYTLHVSDFRVGAQGFGGLLTNGAGPPARFILCPGHARCPRG